MPEAPTDQPKKIEEQPRPAAVQDKFIRFTREIGGDEYVSPDASFLRLTRRPYVLQREPHATRLSDENDLSTLLDLPPESVHDESIEYFYYNPNPQRGGFDFEHSADASFSVGEKRTELNSVEFNNPDGDKFTLRILKGRDGRNPKRFIRIEGSKVKKGIGYRVLYDYGTGRLVSAELMSVSGKREYKDFTQEDDPPPANPRDKLLGKSVILQEPKTITNLRIPAIQNFAEILGQTFPSNVFREPSSTNRESDKTWRNLDWPGNLLHIELSQNGQAVPLSP